MARVEAESPKRGFVFPSVYVSEEQRHLRTVASQLALENWNNSPKREG